MGLTAWWPQRRTYHATEIVAFDAMLGMYFAATGDLDAARRELAMIEDILPDHPAVGALEFAILSKAFRQLAEDARLGGAAAVDPLPHTLAARVLGAAGRGERSQAGWRIGVSDGVAGGSECLEVPLRDFDGSEAWSRRRSTEVRRNQTSVARNFDATRRG